MLVDENNTEIDGGANYALDFRQKMSSGLPEAAIYLSVNSERSAAGQTS